MAIGYGVACPKPSRLDALARKEEVRKQRVRDEAACRKAVDARDRKHGFVCRISGRKLAAVSVRTFRPDRAERHHLVSRTDRKVRNDPRNQILVSYETHALLEANVLKIDAAKQVFYVDSIAYFDAEGLLEVLDTRTGERRWV